MLFIFVYIILLPLCLLLAFFFSGMETGVTAVNRIRVLHKARNGSTRAQVIANYLRDMDRFLGTTLVGTNLVNVGFAVLAADFSYRYWSGEAAERMATITAAISTVVILVFGEYLPKTWFSRRPLDRCIPLAKFLRVCEILLRPLTLFIMWTTSFAAPHGKKRKNELGSREHFRLLAQDSEESGQISAFEQLMINRVLGLHGKTARDIMTPIEQTSVLSADATLDDALAMVRKTSFRKIPLLNDEKTECPGIFYLQDWLETSSTNLPLRPAFYIEDALPADKVLQVMRRNRRHIALVRGAGYAIIGIVTIDSVLANLVGNLPRETTGERKADHPAAAAREAAIEALREEEEEKDE